MLTTNLISVASSLVLLASASPTDPKQKCASMHHPSIVNAIEKFCKPKTDMVIPSYYSNNGAESDDGKYWVSISGACKPKPQWVPQKYCYSQFYDMCINGNEYGEKYSYYGNDNCQKWVLLKQTPGYD